LQQSALMTRAAPDTVRSGKGRTIVNARRLGRLGGLAVGLGIGAALAATPGVASADSSTDPFSWIGGMDLGDLSVPAQVVPAQALDIQVSIFGLDLFPTAGNTATATAGIGDIAIAIGNGANASASGILDTAFADGTNSEAVAGFGILDSATVFGTNSIAKAGSLGGFDSALVFGTDGNATANLGIGDFASVINTGSAPDLADAGGMGFDIDGLSMGNFDIASVVGTGSTADAGFDFTTDTGGSYDLAAAFGDMLNSTAATGGNFLVDIATIFGTL
jgi:hypothetical protein